MACEAGRISIGQFAMAKAGRSASARASTAARNGSLVGPDGNQVVLEVNGAVDFSADCALGGSDPQTRRRRTHGEAASGGFVVFRQRRISLATEHFPPMPALPASAANAWIETGSRSKSSWPAKQAGFRSASGRYWARTSDPQLVELVLSQLS